MCSDGELANVSCDTLIRLHDSFRDMITSHSCDTLSQLALKAIIDYSLAEEYKQELDDITIPSTAEVISILVYFSKMGVPSTSGLFDFFLSKIICSITCLEAASELFDKLHFVSKKIIQFVASKFVLFYNNCSRSVWMGLPHVSFFILIYNMARRLYVQCYPVTTWCWVKEMLEKS